MKKIISSWIGIFVGCTILAAGFVYFINPYNLVPGGVYGASIVLHNLFPSIQVGTFGYMFDIPLLIISVLVLGAKLGARRGSTTSRHCCQVQTVDGRVFHPRPQQSRTINLRP